MPSDVMPLSVTIDGSCSAMIRKSVSISWSCNGVSKHLRWRAKTNNGQ